MKKIFGNKKSFAIALETIQNPEKFKLCFWVLGKRMGSFTKAGELFYSIKAFILFTSNKESFYLPDFEGKTPTQIDHYLINDLFALGRSNKKENIEEYEKRKKLHLFFGPQFSNDGCSIILLYRNDNVIFIYTPPKEDKADEYIISYQDFCNVFEEYIDYCNKKKLV